MESTGNLEAVPGSSKRYGKFTSRLKVLENLRKISQVSFRIFVVVNRIVCLQDFFYKLWDFLTFKTCCFGNVTFQLWETFGNLASPRCTNLRKSPQWPWRNMNSKYFHIFTVFILSYQWHYRLAPVCGYLWQKTVRNNCTTATFLFQRRKHSIAVNHRSRINRSAACTVSLPNWP